MAIHNMQKCNYLLPLILLTLLVVAQFLAASSWAAERANLRVGDQSPRVSIRGVSGGTTTIPDDVHGKVTIVHFWAVGCSSCRDEMPALESLFNRYNKKGLTVIAVNVVKRNNSIKSFLEGLKITYPILIDSDGKAAERYEVAMVPKTFIIDRNGVIRYKIAGEATGDILKKLILNLL